MTRKYNYDEAIKLFINAFNERRTVTYKETQEALGLEKPIDDKSAASTNASIVSTLRAQLKKEYGLTFRSASTGNRSGPDYAYYDITKVKDGNVKKKESSKSNKTEISNEALDALQKNNQQLFAALEQAKAANAALQNHCVKLQEREQEYKKIIDSLYRLSFNNA